MTFDRLRSRRTRPPGSGEADVLVDWSRIADGRPWRLKRGMHFSDSVDSFQQSATEAAALMGRSVVFVRDRLFPNRFVWAQFTAGEIELGEPCPCGGRRMLRVSGSLLRCAACDSVLVARPRPAGESPRSKPRRSRSAAPRRTLAAFSNVRLVLAETSPDARQYVGFGIDADGRNALLTVREPVVDGAPVPDEGSPTGTVHEVTLAVPGLLDLGGDDWDLVLE